MTEAPKLPALPEPHGLLGLRSRYPVFTASQMLAAMAQAAREQMERDAALCEALEDQHWSTWEEIADPEFQGRSNGACECSVAIRSQPEPVAVDAP